MVLKQQGMPAWYTDKDNGSDKINNNLRQLYLWIVMASVGLVLRYHIWFHVIDILSI